jgi:hypothetical protein
MSGILEIKEDYGLGYFDGYVNHLPDRDARRQAALTYLQTKSLNVKGIDSYPTRLILASHWPEQEQATFPEIQKIYRLGPTVRHFAGKNMVRMVGEHPKVLVDAPDDSRAVMFDLFRIPAGNDVDMIISFDTPEPEDLEPDLQGLPFLEYTVDIPVVQQQSLQYSKDRGLEILPAIHGSSLTTAVSATTCLLNSEEMYRRTLRRHSSLDRLLFSNAEGISAVSNLLELVGGEPQERLMQEIVKGDINPHEPLPDLSFLTA